MKGDISKFFELVKAGKYDEVKKMLSQEEGDVFAGDPLYDNAGLTPLHYACMDDKKDLVMLLLAKGANPFLSNASGGASAYALACNSGPKARSAIKDTFFDADSRLSKAEQEFLGWNKKSAAQLLPQPPDQVRTVATAGAGVKKAKKAAKKKTPTTTVSVAESTTPPLKTAASAAELEESSPKAAATSVPKITSKRLNEIAKTYGVSFAIDGENFTIDSNVVGKEGDGTKYSLLQLACSAGNLAEVEELISCGANVNKVNKEGCTPVACACMTTNLKVLQALISAGADVKIKSGTNQTPLHVLVLAAESDSPALVPMAKLLIFSGVSINAVDKHGFSAATYAKKKGFSKIKSVIDNQRVLRNTAQIDSVMNAEPLKTYLGGDLSQYSGQDLSQENLGDVKKLFAMKILQDNDLSLESIFFCLCNRSLAFANESEDALQRKARLREFYQKNPTHPSLNAEFLENLDTATDFQLQQQEERVMFVVTKDLLASGLNVMQLVETGLEVGAFTSYLNIACENGNFSLARLVLEEFRAKDAELVKKPHSASGHTALHSCAMYNNRQSLEVAQNILKIASDQVDVSDKQGRTPLMAAVLSKNPEIVEMFLQNDANPNTSFDEEKKSLMRYIIFEKENLRMINLMVDYRAEVNCLDANGKTPLTFACEIGDEGLVRKLLEKGARINLPDRNGKKPEDLASEGIKVIFQAEKQKKLKEIQDRVAAAKSATAGASSAASEYEPTLPPPPPSTIVVPTITAAVPLKESEGQQTIS